jgi:hypothetical protein
MTQLLVIDTKTMNAKAFDGRVFIQEAHLGIDEDTTTEGVIEVLEDLRMMSTVHLKEVMRQMDLMEQQDRDARRWAPKNVVPVVFKPWPIPKLTGWVKTAKP